MAQRQPGRFKCNRCGKTFNNQEQLRDHESECSSREPAKQI